MRAIWFQMLRPQPHVAHTLLRVDGFPSEAVIMKIIQWWLASFHAERELWSQGYIVVYGAGTSFVLPVPSNDRPTQKPSKRFTAQGAALRCFFSQAAAPP
jgi:hypothetical protein